MMGDFMVYRASQFQLKRNYGRELLKRIFEEKKRIFSVKSFSCWLGLFLSTQVCLAQTKAPGNIESLIRAVSQRNMEQIHAILTTHPNLNVRTERGETALGEAISQGLISLIKELVTAGADPNFVAAGGDTPLMQAAFTCSLETTEFLLKHGALVNSMNNTSETALLDAAHACWDGRVTRLLIKAGASVNAKAKDGQTPLIVAAFAGNEEAVGELVRAGANVNATDANRDTALKVARDREVGRKKSHDRIYAYLRDVSKK